MATFWEIAAHSVDICSLCIMTICNIVVISHLGFEGWSWVLFATVSDFCILFTFIASAFRVTKEDL